MSYFPMMIDLEKKEVLVIGGGEEGKNKVKVLYDFGAFITLIAPEADQDAIGMASRYINRAFSDEDILDKEYTLVVAATDDRTCNERISMLATKGHIPVNVVDDTELCTFIFPAIVKDKDVVCAVSSGGKSPYVAKYVKKLIMDVMPPMIGLINDRMGVYRNQAKNEFDSSEERRSFLKKKLEELLKEHVNHTYDQYSGGLR